MSDLVRRLTDWRDYEYSAGEVPYETLSDAIDRIRELEEEVAELRSVLDNAQVAQVAQYALEMIARAEAAEGQNAALKAKLRAIAELPRYGVMVGSEMVDRNTIRGPVAQLYELDRSYDPPPRDVVILANDVDAILKEKGDE